MILDISKAGAKRSRKLQVTNEFRQEHGMPEFTPKPAKPKYGFQVNSSPGVNQQAVKPITIRADPGQLKKLRARGTHL